MFQFTFCSSTWKIVIKAFFGPILYVLHSSLNNDAFFIRGMRWWSIFKNLQAWGGYHVPLSVEIICLPWILIKRETNRSATNIFRSLDMLNPRICLFLDSIATYQSQMNSEPTYQGFIDYEFLDFLSLCNYLFRIVFLYPVPYWNMISFDKARW